MFLSDEVPYVNLNDLLESGNAEIPSTASSTVEDTEMPHDESYDVTQDDQNKDEAVDGFGSNNDVVYVNTEIRGKDSDEAILCCDNNFGLPLYAKPLQKHDIPNPHKATDIYGSVTFNGGELVAKQFHHDKETSVTNNEGSESLLTPSNDKSTGKRVTGRKDVWKKEQWYFKDTDRMKAENILNQNRRPGMFLVRDSSVSGAYVISQVIGNEKSGYTIGHYKVHSTGSNVFWLNKDKTFSGLEPLVEYYREHPVGQCDGECLSLPCSNVNELTEPTESSSRIKESRENDTECLAVENEKNKDEKARLQLSDCSTADTNNKTSKNSNPAVRHDILSKIRKDAEKEEYVQFVYDVITVYGRNFTEKFFPEIYT